MARATKPTQAGRHSPYVASMVHHHQATGAKGPWTLWRAGALDAHAHPGPDHNFLAFLDDRRPDAHRPRIGSVLCAVDLPGAVLLADRDGRPAEEICEVTCRAPEPWVYRTSVYDELTNAHAGTVTYLPGTPSWRHAFGLAGDYWQTAMPLGTYVNEREKLDAEWAQPGSVEVHTDPAAVRHV